MKAYLLSLVGAILLSAVVSALVSDRKMGRFIKGMMQLFVFSVVALPLISLFGGEGFRFSAAEEAAVDTDYLERCAELLSEEREGEIGRYLSDKYGVRAEVRAVYGGEYGLTLEKIEAKLFPDGIFGQDEHIDMVARVGKALEARYGCEAEVAWGTAS